MNTQQIIEIFNQLGIEVDFTKAAKFLSYMELLKEHNAKYNLTAITEDVDIIKKHFADSILGMEFLPNTGKIIDIGSGAGFPAIPIKIMNENLDFTLLDSVNKKVNFLNIVIKELGLEKIHAYHKRIEEEAIGKGREIYDCVIARAVSPLPTLCEYALPLLKEGGVFLAYKSEKVDEELKLSENAINILGGKIEKVVKMRVFNEFERSFVIIKKVKKTPFNYPRMFNKPRISPL